MLQCFHVSIRGPLQHVTTVEHGEDEIAAALWLLDVVVYDRDVRVVDAAQNLRFATKHLELE